MDIMKFRPIIVDDSQQELTKHGTDDFPISMDEQQADHANCSMIPHWHYEIQISVVTKGSVKFVTPTGTHLLHVGEGIFVNQGILHEVVKTDETGSVYICVNFKPEMIYGYAESLIRREYVDPLVFNHRLQSIVLQSEAWHREICGIVMELGRIYNAKEYAYEIEMKFLLHKIWHILVLNNYHMLEEPSILSISDKQRAKQLQLFIYDNYMEKISLKDIARAAQVSRGECCRVFKRVFQITPTLYLKKHRIAQSIKMLACTDYSISEIAQKVGFTSSSYYTKCFKSEMDCTPKEYRRRQYSGENAEENIKI